jgi:hypothetical protein
MSGIAADAVLTTDSSRSRWQGTGKTPRLLTTLDSRLTLQKLARTTPGMTTVLSLSVFPKGELVLGSRQSTVDNPQSRALKSEIRIPKSEISSIRPAAFEIRDPRPQIRNGLLHRETRVIPGNPSKPESKLRIRETS